MHALHGCGAVHVVDFEESDEDLENFLAELRKVNRFFKNLR
jgi:hypothetical protein